MAYPKECINDNCKNIIYVEKQELILPLQCPKCAYEKMKSDLQKIQIWSEGFSVTGQQSGAILLWEGLAKDFEDAVSKYREANPTSEIRTADNGYYIWGCELFDNEQDARKSFG